MYKIGDASRALRISKEWGSIYMISFIGTDRNSKAVLYLTDEFAFEVFDTSEYTGHPDVHTVVKEDSDYYYIYHPWGWDGGGSRILRLTVPAYTTTITQNVNTTSLTLTDVPIHHISKDIPNFYKNYNSLSQLFTGLGVPTVFPNNHPIYNKFHVPAGSYLKITLRNVYIDQGSENLGVGHANMLIAPNDFEGYAYLRTCAEMQYPLIGIASTMRAYLDLLNWNNDFLSITNLYFTRHSGDDHNFLGNIYIKFSGEVWVKGYFEAISVDVTDSIAETVFGNVSSFVRGINEIQL